MLDVSLCSHPVGSDTEARWSVRTCHRLEVHGPAGGCSEMKTQECHARTICDAACYDKMSSTPGLFSGLAPASPTAAKETAHGPRTGRVNRRSVHTPGIMASPQVLTAVATIRLLKRPGSPEGQRGEGISTLTFRRKLISSALSHASQTHSLRVGISYYTPTLNTIRGSVSPTEIFL